MSDYVTIKELAKRSSMSEKTVSKLIKRGEFPHYRPDPNPTLTIRAQILKNEGRPVV
jgi:hypothetical protein